MYFCICCVKEDGKEKDRFLTFDDEQFEDYCLEHFDADGDGVISEWEAAKVDTIFLSQRTIKSLETISNFSNLIYLHIGECQEILELNLSRNQKLKHLSISYLFDLKTIDMAQCERLEYVHIQHCGKLDRLDLCNNAPQLRRLTIKYTNLTGLVLPKSETLESLVILFCGLEAIDVQRCWNVNNIEIRGTQLKSLNCGNLTELQHLSCCDNELVSLSLSGCGIYTKYEPVTSVPDQLYGGEVVAEDTASLGNMDWRELFTDPHLQSLIEQGLQNNTDYQSAELRVEEAQATLMSAKLAFLPAFALAPQGTVSSFDTQQATQTYSLPVTASWELDVFGRMRNAKKQSKALYAQSQDYRQAVRTQLIAGIANTYYTLLMLDQQLAISRQTEETWRETVASTRALMNAGMANESAVSQMEATYYQVQTSVLDLEEQINQVENSLALLLAETPRHYERGVLAEQQFPVGFSIGIPVQMLSCRPDVRSAERTLEAAFYGTNAARSAFYPSITLGGSAGWTNSAGSMIVNPGKFLASAVGSLTQPLFARGQVIAQYRIARAQQEEASLAFQQTLLNAGSEVNDALTAWQTSLSKSELLDKQVASLQTAARSTSLLMEHGNTTYLEVLTARQTLLNAQLAQTANRFSEIQSLINLYKALGGGQE